SVLRELKKLLSKYGKVESIRFRSIAFNHVKNRKAAFLSKDFHEGRDTLNAYVVFKEKDAATSALELNGTVFEGKHLRADRSVPSQRTHDPKRSVFLGNLPFDVAEEDVWNAFEDCGEIVYVRIIRDSATNLGKGFGYVQFSDPLAADLALQRGPVDVSGREIRVTRCARRGAASSSEGVRSAPLARPALRAKGRRTGVQGASGATRPAAQKRGGKPPRKSK
ncbi:Nucleolar protein 12, partial [Cladochytrium tenue]